MPESSVTISGIRINDDEMICARDRVTDQSQSMNFLA